MVKSEQVVLITGASRGFGKATARELAERGHSVVATMRNPDRDGPAVTDGLDDRIAVTACDVTDRASVDAAVAFALQRYGRIDVLFNNAGYGLYGPVEDLSEAEIQRQMDTNFVGQIRLIQAVLPHMRERGEGKLILMSSALGRTVMGPLLGLYCASKYALEALGEALRYEVSRWGVQVTLVEPGMTSGDWQLSSLDVAERIRTGLSPYQESVDPALLAFRERTRTRPGARAVGAIVADMVEIEQPLPLRWPIGDDTQRIFDTRALSTDDQWERMLRSEGATFMDAFFDAEREQSTAIDARVSG